MVRLKTKAIQSGSDKWAMKPLMLVALLLWSPAILASTGQCDEDIIAPINEAGAKFVEKIPGGTESSAITMFERTVLVKVIRQGNRYQFSVAPHIAQLPAEQTKFLKALMQQLTIPSDGSGGASQSTTLIFTRLAGEWEVASQCFTKDSSISDIPRSNEEEPTTPQYLKPKSSEAASN